MSPEKRSPLLLQILTITLALTAGLMFTLAENDGKSGWVTITCWMTAQVLLVTLGAWWFRRRVAWLDQPPAVSPLFILVVSATLAWELFARWLGVDWLL